MNYKMNDGEVIIFPTDTVYGIGCKLLDFKAIERIFSIKHRDPNKRLAVLISSLSQLEGIIEITEDLQKLAKAFWPGALTIVVKLNRKIQHYDETIGIRIPNCEIALDILNMNGAMATTSVNISGEAPLDTFEEIKENYSNQVDQIFEKKEASSHISSTVVILEENGYRLTRVGQIKEEDIRRVLNKESFIK